MLVSFASSRYNVLYNHNEGFFLIKKGCFYTMNRTAVVTDSNSGITQDQAELLDIHVLPMPFFINEELFFEDINLTQEQFYEHLKADATISTSMPSPGDVTDLWDKLLETYEEVIYIPMSSGLSSSCQTAMMLAEDYNGKVQVIDNQQISVPMRQSIMDAKELIRRGHNAVEVKKILEARKKESSIYITVDTLEYLKRGGRVTPAAAAIGTILNIKPVLSIQGDKLDAHAKCRGTKAAKRTTIEAMKHDLETRFAEAWNSDRIHLFAAYSGDPEEAKIWLAELQEAFPGHDIQMNPLSLSVSCHTGPGALGVGCSVKLPEEA